MFAHDAPDPPDHLNPLPPGGIVAMHLARFWGVSGTPMNCSGRPDPPITGQIASPRMLSGPRLTAPFDLLFPVEWKLTGQTARAPKPRKTGQPALGRLFRVVHRTAWAAYLCQLRCRSRNTNPDDKSAYHVHVHPCPGGGKRGAEVHLPVSPGKPMPGCAARGFAERFAAAVPGPGQACS